MKQASRERSQADNTARGSVFQVTMTLTLQVFTLLPSHRSLLLFLHLFLPKIIIYLLDTSYNFVHPDLITYVNPVCINPCMLVVLQQLNEDISNSF